MINCDVTACCGLLACHFPRAGTPATPSSPKAQPHSGIQFPWGFPDTTLDQVGWDPAGDGNSAIVWTRKAIFGRQENADQGLLVESPSKEHCYWLVRKTCVLRAGDVEDNEVTKGRVGYNLLALTRA